MGDGHATKRVQRRKSKLTKTNLQDVRYVLVGQQTEKAGRLAKVASYMTSWQKLLTDKISTRGAPFGVPITLFAEGFSTIWRVNDD